MEFATANLRQALRNNAASLGLPAFWRWWAAELAALVPSAPRTALKRRRLRPVLAFEDGVAVLWAPRVVDGVLGLAEAVRIPLTGDAAAVAHAGRAAIEGLPQRAYGGIAATPRMVIALPRSQVLRKQMTLPAAVEENLKEALAYDLDRHTPFRPDQLYFDAVVIARDGAKKEIRVDWAAALRTVVDQARAHADGWGATVVSVTPEAFEPTPASGAMPAVGSKLNLLPDAERPDRAVWRRWQFWLPVGLMAAAALVAVVLPVWQKRDYVIALSLTTEQARVQAAASDALRHQLDQAVSDYNFALERKYLFPSAVQLLDDVTRLLPDDTWLTQLEMKSMPKGKEPHREIVLRGESGNAGILVSKLEESKLFEQAAPRSPTTKIQPGPGEVFDLGAQLKSLPPPQAIVLARAAPPAATPPPGAAKDAQAAKDPAAAKDAGAAKDAADATDAVAGKDAAAAKDAVAGKDAATAKGTMAGKDAAAAKDEVAGKDAATAKGAGAGKDAAAPRGAAAAKGTARAAGAVPGAALAGAQDEAAQGAAGAEAVADTSSGDADATAAENGDGTAAGVAAGAGATAGAAAARSEAASDTAPPARSRSSRRNRQ